MADKKLTLIICPTCKSQKKIEIPNELIYDADNIVTISVPKGLICEHTFHAFIDRDFEVRGYQLADLELPNADNDLKMLHLFERTRKSDILVVEIIRLNIKPQILSYLIRGNFFNKNVIFVVPETKIFLEPHIDYFFKLIFEKYFKLNISIVNEPNYVEIKSCFENDIVIGMNEIINDNDKIMNSTKMVFETKIVNDFYFNPSSQNALIDIKYEIRKAFSICKNVINIVENLKTNEEFDRFTIVAQHIDFIIDVARYYFKKHVPIKEYIASI